MKNKKIIFFLIFISFIILVNTFGYSRRPRRKIFRNNSTTKVPMKKQNQLLISEKKLSTENIPTKSSSHSSKVIPENLPKRTTFSNKNNIPVINTDTLPIYYTVKDIGKAGVSKIDLYYTKDGGKTWHFYASDLDLKPPIIFKVKEDGEYGFYTVATDKAGNMEPLPVKGTKPHVSVIIDRKQPEVKILSPLKGDVFNTITPRLIRWIGYDDNIRPDGVKIEYSLDNGKTWNKIVEGISNTGEYEWKPPFVSSQYCMVRITLLDLAGNKGSAITGPFISDGLPPITEILGPYKTSNKKFQIKFKAYDRGGAGIKEVELWYKLPDTQWQKYGTYGASDLNYPILFISPCEGNISLMLVGIDKVGNKEPSPTATTTIKKPFTTAVDLTLPSVRLLSFESGGIYQGGNIYDIKWEATDTNLKEKPISIFYSLDNGKQWQVIAENLPNTGVFGWRLPQVDTGGALIKVIAEDQMKNKGIAISKVPFIIDSHAPQSQAFFGEKLSSAPTNTLDSQTVNPNEIEQQIEKAYTLFHQKKYSEARGILDALIEKGIGKVEVYLLSGKIYLKQHNYSKAKEEFLKALLLDTDNFMAHSNLAYIYGIQKDYKKAIMEYKKAIKLKPENPELHANIGYLYYKEGDYKKAKFHFLQALHKNKLLPTANWYMAKICEKEGDFEKAIYYWKQTVVSYGKDSKFGKMALKRIKMLEKLR